MSNIEQYWALPDGIKEALPADAARLEQLRRELLDLYATWGYQLVMPPLVEYVESLRIAQGTALDLQTFKLTDQLNGRMMGVRADMTPQVARMDAHRLSDNPINRLCYIGTVLRTREVIHTRSRSLLQVGAELFGHIGMDSDVEILSLLLNTLAHCCIPEVVLSIGHISIFQGLVAQAGLDQQQEQQYFDILMRKSMPELAQWLSTLPIPESTKTLLSQLPRLQGDVSVLQQASNALATATIPVHEALDYLQRLVQRLQSRFPTLNLHIDLADLSGYDYHTGVVYAAYTPSKGNAIARGGRYDGIGTVFGRARPATGFSADLHELSQTYRPKTPLHPATTILAPADQDAELEAMIQQLREQGYCVIRSLIGQDNSMTSHYPQQLVKQGGKWIISNV